MQNRNKVQKEVRKKRFVRIPVQRRRKSFLRFPSNSVATSGFRVLEVFGIVLQRVGILCRKNFGIRKCAENQIFVQ